jgi:hypothetical protein
VFGVGMGTASVCIEVNRDPELEAVAELLDVEGVIDEAGGMGFATPEPIGGTVVTPLGAKPYVGGVRGRPYKLLYMPPNFLCPPTMSLKFLRPPTTFLKFYNAARTSSCESEHPFVTPKIV